MAKKVTHLREHSPGDLSREFQGRVETILPLGENDFLIDVAYNDILESEGHFAAKTVVIKATDELKVGMMIAFYRTREPENVMVLNAEGMAVPTPMAYHRIVKMRIVAEPKGL